MSEKLARKLARVLPMTRKLLYDIIILCKIMLIQKRAAAGRLKPNQNLVIKTVLAVFFIA